MSKIHAVLMAAAVIATPSLAQDVSTKVPVDQLIATLKSDASHQEKADACRQLALTGTRDAVPALAAMLSDEKLAHMARYALEPISDPAVDAALRDALGRLKGRPLVGVICSIGVRRDKMAAPSLAKLLQDADAEVAQAAARALGRLGGAEAAKALQDALASAPAANQLALFEGQFRCAGVFAADGQRDEAIAIYDRLRSLPAPHQVRAGALCAAILAREQDGVPLLAEHLHSQDYTLFTAAVRAAQQLPGAAVTSTLTSALDQLPADRQIVVVQTLGRRGDAAALPMLASLAKKSAKPVRLAAVRALAELSQAPEPPVVLELLGETDRELARAVLESLAGLHLPRDQQLAVCRQAAQLAQGVEEKRMLLLLLGNAAAPETLALVPPLLAEPEIRDEAAETVVSAVERFLKQPDARDVAAQLVKPLEKVTQAPVPPDLAKRAKTALQQAQSMTQKQ